MDRPYSSNFFDSKHSDIITQRPPIPPDRRSRFSNLTRCLGPLTFYLNVVTYYTADARLRRNCTSVSLDRLLSLRLGNPLLPLAGQETIRLVSLLVTSVRVLSRYLPRLAPGWIGARAGSAPRRWRGQPYRGGEASWVSKETKRTRMCATISINLVAWKPASRRL